ncbi:hypothetical protein [Enterococcus lemanii]|jgi:hypothetical protein|uniref:Uncharacterized protein n=1 Tax=Enterococcus lemanii TaxID=1159752 RepID=A0ABV9MSJ7_9ENTE|nr:hypothetical protein [Enterococcus lemanii]MBM7710134.1 hypothetical protein [Enterococcus lemanii]
MQEQEKDWLFRYQYIYRVRHSEKSKQRFLKALVADLSTMREDVRIIEYDRQKKSANRNVYIGNIEDAKEIICTYYDTPTKSFGPYVFFDREAQKRQTLIYLLSSSLLLVFLGFFFTLLYMNQVKNPFDFTSGWTWLAMAGFGGFFYLLSQYTKGKASKKTFIRNTSSILALLMLLKKNNQEKRAFAFIDEGCYGNRGLKELGRLASKNCRIVLLDSIGSNAPLYAIGQGFSEMKLSQNAIQLKEVKQRVNYVISASEQLTKGQPILLLTKKELEQKQLNQENFKKIIALFE